MNKKAIKKIKEGVVGKFLPFAQDLKDEGKKDYEIIDIYEKYVENKEKAFYNNRRTFHSYSEIIHRWLNNYKPDSVAEEIFYDILFESGLDFYFQYKIGNYRVDFLINDKIVLECDGPYHVNQVEYDKKRDLYLESIGYYVVRLTWKLIMQAPDIVIQELKELSNKIEIAKHRNGPTGLVKLLWHPKTTAFRSVAR